VGDASSMICTEFYRAFSLATRLEIYMSELCLCRFLICFKVCSLVVSPYIGFPLEGVCHTILTMSIKSSLSAQRFRNLKGEG